MPLSSDCANREQLVIDEGQLIAGHYRLLEQIGSGSMGVVWRARDERLERIVGIKQLLLQPGLTEEQKQDARRRALREARIAAKLHHPNAIVVFDVAEHDGDPCIVMEYLAARSLAVVLGDQGSLSVEEVAALGTQIASAIAVAHASGIVHRDIKPGNILITDSGIAKITDFGIARAIGDVTITQTGMFAGTPAYLAPEVARGSDPTSASDVFSFGATLYDAVEGGPPFPERQNQLALLRLVAEGIVQPPRQAGPLTALLMQLLRPEPADRPTMAQASRLLAELAGSKLPATVLAGVPRNPTRPDLVPAKSTEAKTAVDAAPQSVSKPEPVTAPEPSSSPIPSAAFLPGDGTQLVDRPKAAPDLRKRALLLGAVVLVLVVAGVGIWLASMGGGGQNQAGGGTSSTNTSTNQAAPPAGGGKSTTGNTSTQPSTVPDSATPPVPPGTSSGTILYPPVGNKVLAFYSTNALTGGGAAQGWAMLSPSGQSYYGSEAQFAAYWQQFTQISSAHEVGLTTNSDGSVQCPADVTYGPFNSSASFHKNVRVIQVNGQLLIDSDTRIPNTPWPPAPSTGGNNQ
ncbi:MAG TPA: serine/threonine-protein kinase [Pseudonocardiaceae bacterium]|jgi:serine/threonine protein kinase|nr:serine/threonine-protein kinase [Pseudonocardiaceae bacterium]